MHHHLNDKQDSPLLSVTLERALQFVSSSRAMLFHFPGMDHQQTGFATFAFDSLWPFLLVRLARGPNYRRVQALQDVNRLIPVSKVTFVIGFAEERGERWQYNEEDVLELVAMMKHQKFRGLDLGVFLSAEFLAESRGVLQFQPLRELPNFKYLFVRAGLIRTESWNPSGSQVKNLKYNIRQLGRETFLHTDWPLRQGLYQWESIEDPPPPTTPTTTTTTKAPTLGTASTGTAITTTSTTPTTSSTSTTTTTTEMPPNITDVTLTSDHTPTTTSFFLNYTDVTFPTVKDISGATHKRELTLAVIVSWIISWVSV